MNVLEENPDLPPPRKQESEEIDTLEKLNALNDAEIVQGYREGWDDPRIPIGMSKSYMHGWLNAQVDQRRMKGSAAGAKLASEYVNRKRSTLP